jgi:very-short-patch-repair endonuclease
MPKKTMSVNLKNSSKRSAPEDDLAKQLFAAGFKDFRRNARFIPKRKFEADFFLPHLRLVIEVDGGLWMARGGHTSGVGAKRDRERDILAYLTGGILTIRVATDHVKSGQAIEWIKEIIPLREREINGDS